MLDGVPKQVLKELHKTTLTGSDRLVRLGDECVVDVECGFVCRNGGDHPDWDGIVTAVQKPNEQQNFTIGYQILCMVVGNFPPGLVGLDEVLHGGLCKNHNALIRRQASTSKTIFGLQILFDSVEDGKTNLNINIGDPRDYVKETVKHFDLNPDAIRFLDLSVTPGLRRGRELFGILLRGSQTTFVYQVYTNE